MKKLLHVAAITGTLLVMSSMPAYAQTGWVNTNGNYYYYDSNGDMCKGWTQINETMYYFGPNYGAMQTGLLTIDNHLYYFNPDGAMTKGTATLPDGRSYTFNENGMLTASPGWQLVNNRYYYFDSSNSVVTGWKKVDGYYVNSDGERMDGVLSRGIDVSRYQNEINWNAVAQDDVAFAIIRVGSVKYGVDARYHENMRAANANGIKTGIYLYSYATTPEEARAEAEFVLSNIQDYQVSFPIAYDVEDNVHKSLSPQQLSELINAFCSVILENGYYPVVYSSKSWFNQRIDTSQINHIDKWVAQYYTECEYPNPSIWQASSSGRINGINGNVDIDFQYKDYNSTFVQNGWAIRGGKWFYFLDHRKQTGWVNDNGTYYFLDAKGAMQTGWHKEENSWFYLASNGAMQTGWGDIESDRYFFDSNGIMQTGWTEINENFHYFDPSGVMQTGWHQENEDYYYLDAVDGSMATNWLFLNNIWYYMGSNGVMKTGFQTIDNAKYYLAPNGAMLTGWNRINDKRYYFHDNGQMALGFTTLGKDTFYFDELGVLTTGWNQLNKDWYYFDGNGVMQKGFVSFGATTFYFDEVGKMAVGWKSIDNNWYYFDENGYKRTGWLELKDAETNTNFWYYLDANGKMQTGWLGNQYLNPEGKLLTGWVQVDGSWYYLNEETGKTFGWLQLEDIWYYFDTDGKMLANQTATIDGVDYQFAPDGAWVTQTPEPEETPSLPVNDQQATIQ
ncbi:MAG: glycoside hydrolase [Lachnospiraceae bacterium]|nr:glycoside hydrolase [Lachnospiraceae bacterium]